MPLQRHPTPSRQLHDTARRLRFAPRRCRASSVTSIRESCVRHDKIDQHGTVTIPYQRRLHHIGMGRALNGRRVILLVAGRHIRVLDQQGELLRELILDPDRYYQPR
ncbi:MAG: IS481 family transposase, partial [Actinomycetota bacterium]|nr:IS481 family transposase [Actinomycetota bacterium]